MTHPISNSNVIQFPIQHTVFSKEQHATRLKRLAANLAAQTADDRADHVATVVRICIRSAQRKGRSLASVNPTIRGWLLDLAELGDPTCQMVRDWLNGKCCLDLTIGKSDAED